MRSFFSFICCGGGGGIAVRAGGGMGWCIFFFIFLKGFPTDFSWTEKPLTTEIFVGISVGTVFPTEFSSEKVDFPMKTFTTPLFDGIPSETPLPTEIRMFSRDFFRRKQP